MYMHDHYLLLQYYTALMVILVPVLTVCVFHMCVTLPHVSCRVLRLGKREMSTTSGTQPGVTSVSWGGWREGAQIIVHTVSE